MLARRMSVCAVLHASVFALWPTADACWLCHMLLRVLRHLSLSLAFVCQTVLQVVCGTDLISGCGLRDAIAVRRMAYRMNRTAHALECCVVGRPA